MNRSKSSSTLQTRKTSHRGVCHNANFPSRSLCQGENLDFLRMMNSESVDLIATDPPFNSGRDYFADPNSISKGAYFPDKWAWSVEMRDQHLKELEEINFRVYRYVKTVWQTLDDGALTSFLLFMSLRIVEMHRLLKPTGSVYLHCDHHASHYLKQLMDIVFGVDNFRNEIVWKRYRGKRAAKNPSCFARVTDTILFYTKGGEYNFNLPFSPLRDDYVKSVYKHNDNDGKGPYRFGGRIRDRKYYLSNSRGIPAVSLWDDINELNGTASESTGYPTQKPVALYERIVKTSSDESEVVLDPFCGCATTLVAAENLGRHWIGIDIHPQTRTITANRIAKACKLNSPDGSVIAESTLLNLEKDLDIHVFNKKDFPSRTN